MEASKGLFVSDAKIIGYMRELQHQQGIMDSHAPRTRLVLPVIIWVVTHQNVSHGVHIRQCVAWYETWGWCLYVGSEGTLCIGSKQINQKFYCCQNIYYSFGVQVVFLTFKNLCTCACAYWITFILWVGNHWFAKYVSYLSFDLNCLCNCVLYPPKLKTSLPVVLETNLAEPKLPYLVSLCSNDFFPSIHLHNNMCRNTDPSRMEGVRADQRETRWANKSKYILM